MILNFHPQLQNLPIIINLLAVKINISTGTYQAVFFRGNSIITFQTSILTTMHDTTQWIAKLCHFQ